MKKTVLALSFMAVLALVGCKSNDFNQAATPQICNQPYPTPYNQQQQAQPNCLPYNGNYYQQNVGGAFYGCPIGYVPVATTNAGTGGMTCVSSIIVGYSFGAYPNPLPYMGSGPLQQCDTYNPNNACGTASGLRCVSYSGQRYGFCTQ